MGAALRASLNRLRTVFAMAFAKMRLETGAPLLIFAPRDEYAMKAMAPAFWKGSGPKPAGLFPTRLGAAVCRHTSRPGRCGAEQCCLSRICAYVVARQLSLAADLA